jgi:rhamnosyltransferase
MNSSKATIGVFIPTFNGGSLWKKAVEALQRQRSDFDKILIIDSGSTDDTITVAQEAGFTVEKIPSSEFNPGRTRNIGIHKIDCDIVVLLTQDSILMDNSISLIAKVLNNESIAVAYGRQLPHDDATPIAKFARLFNYREEGYIYELRDKDKHGIKTAFSSDTFSAYNRKFFIEIGGFPDKIIGSEDMYLAAKALLSGYKVCYAAKALCKHSHNYTFTQEFKRYFDIGVFHQNEFWIREAFGKLKNEGINFILSELLFLWKKRNFHWIPIAFIHNFLKVLGYKLGQNYKKLPHKLAIRFSAYKVL